MLAIAFYLAIVTFFIPKKYKQICGYISMGIFGVLLINWLIGFFFHFYLLPDFLFFGKQFDTLDFIDRIIHFKFIKYFDYCQKSGIGVNKIAFFIFDIYKLFIYIIALAIAYAATKVSIIKYKSDKEFEEGYNSETTSDIVSTAADGRLLRVVEVNAGLCTGTLRGAAIEAKINKMAAEGWKFEQFESIIGRCCLIFARYKAVICFSKEK